MALNTLKCNRLMPLPFKGLMWQMNWWWWWWWWWSKMQEK